MADKGLGIKVGLGIVLILFTATMLLSGCNKVQSRSEDNAFFDEWKEQAERSKGFSPPKKKKANLGDRRLGYLSRQKVKPVVNKPLPTKRVTVKLRDLDVSTVLRAIAKSVDQNILINDQVKGTVTVDVQNVPWDQVFNGVLKTQGLTYSWEGDILRIIKIEDLEIEIKRDVQTLIVPIEYADAGKMQENLQNVLTTFEASEMDEEGAKTYTGTVLVDEHNNALIIQASRKDIQRLLPIIEELDRPTYQVLIEAHIVEATKDAARELGVRWGGLYQNGNQSIYPGGNGSPVFTGENASAPTGGWSSNFPGSMNVAEGPAFTLGYFLGEIGGNMLAAELNALQSDGKVNILSSPSVTTLDNQRALIESGNEVPFQTVDENGKIVIEYKKATLKLEVTPFVIDGELLKMQIITKKDELDFTRAADAQGNPIIRTKNAETTVVVADGETTVIGGLNIEKGEDTSDGVPGLKDVPGLGWFFKADKTSKNFEELLIFITPYVLAERQTNASAVKVK